MGNEKVQGTPEWLEYRRTRIGASEAASILGISPYKSALQLWEEKIGLREPPPMNPAMLRGNQLEPEVRAQYEALSGISFMPQVVTHPKHDFIIASLDGINFEESKLLEIKCCNRTVFDACKDGVVVPHYMSQMQHQLACCPQATECHYVCFNGGEIAYTIVKPDPEFQQDMLDKELEFYECMVNNVSPGAAERDHIEIDEPEFLFAAEQYILAKRKLEEAKIVEATYKKMLLELTDDGNCRGGGLRITRCNRENTDYKKAAVDSGVDLSKYKKQSVGYWKITEEK